MCHGSQLWAEDYGTLAIEFIVGSGTDQEWTQFLTSFTCSFCGKVQPETEDQGRDPFLPKSKCTCPSLWYHVTLLLGLLLPFHGVVKTPPLITVSAV